MKRQYVVLVLLLAILGIGKVAAGDSFERSGGIIGILPLQEVFGVEPCDHFTPRDLALFRNPRAPASLGRIYVSKPWTFSPAGGCEGLEVSVELTGQETQERLPTLEFAYENLGAIVKSRDGKWFQIALKHDYAWLRIDDDGRYLPVEGLLKESLAYLRGGHPVVLLKEPASGAERVYEQTGGKTEVSVKVIEFRQVAGTLWVEVEVMDKDPCDRENTGQKAVTGWVPFHDQEGYPTIWFYSRGC